MIFISNSEVFVQLTSVPEFSKLNVFPIRLVNLSMSQISQLRSGKEHLDNHYNSHLGVNEQVRLVNSD